MSGTYGMRCCRCGTSCGGLNFPFRGWKDSFYEGGFRAIGILHAPMLRSLPGSTYDGVFSLVDWWATLVDTALSLDEPDVRLSALVMLRKRGLLPQLAWCGGGGEAGGASACATATGPIDSLSHWHYFARSESSATSSTFNSLHPEAQSPLSGVGKVSSTSLPRHSPAEPLLREVGGEASPSLLQASTRSLDSPAHPINSPSPRSEILLAGFASDRSSAAIRVGALKLLVGRWGSPLWCDLNASGYSPVYPAPSGEPSALGGEGGVVCTDLQRSNHVGNSASDVPAEAQMWQPVLEWRTDPDPTSNASADAARQLRVMEAHSRSLDLPVLSPRLDARGDLPRNPTLLTTPADMRMSALDTTLPTTYKPLTPPRLHDSPETDDTRTASRQSAGTGGAADPCFWEGLEVQLYDVVADPREMTNLAGERPADVKRLMGRLVWWNSSRVQSIHRPEDPAGERRAKDTGCWQPWRTYT
jgi:hypothetical protein